jgi:hypothetical protein
MEGWIYILATPQRCQELLPYQSCRVLGSKQDKLQSCLRMVGTEDNQDPESHHWKAKSRYWLRTHKFGIEIPKDWNQAIAIDWKNGNTLWRDSIHKEMKVVRPAFEVHEGEAKDLVGYTKITSHRIFDVKMGENFK